MTAPPGQLRPITPPPSPDRRPASRIGLVVRLLGALVFTALSAVVVLPDLLGLDGRTPFAQQVAFRPWFLLVGVVIVGVLALAPQLRRREARRRARLALAPFTVGALAVLLVGAGLVLPRVVADPLPTSGTPLTVLTVNVYEGNADQAEIADLIARQQPDLVSLTEAGEPYLRGLAPLVEPLGYRIEVSTQASTDVTAVIALVSDRLGEVTFRVGEETASFPYLEVTGGGLGDLRFVAYHASAPVAGQIPRWRADLALLSQWCAGPTPAIIAGDFNSTLDHSALRAGMTGCNDAAAQRGAGLEPTWSPTDRTQVFGPQIDRVVSTDGIEAETFSVQDVTGSDHRAVATRLRVP